MPHLFYGSFFGAPHIDHGLLFIQVAQTDGMWVYQIIVVLNLSYNQVAQGLNSRYATLPTCAGYIFMCVGSFPTLVGYFSVCMRVLT